MVKAGGDPGDVRRWLVVAGLWASGGWSLRGRHPAGHSLDSSGRQLARYAGVGTGGGSEVGSEVDSQGNHKAMLLLFFFG